MLSSLSSLMESLLPLFRGGATARLAAATPPPSPSPSDSLDHDEDSSSGDNSSHGVFNSSHTGSRVVTNAVNAEGIRRSSLAFNQRKGVGTSK